MAKEITYSDKGFEKNSKIAETVKKKPFWKRWKCHHHYLYVGMACAGFRKVYICGKCGHTDIW